MDGFTGFKTATTEELPDTTAVMDPFHVVRLAGEALDQLTWSVPDAVTASFRGRDGRSAEPCRPRPRNMGIRPAHDAPGFVPPPGPRPGVAAGWVRRPRRPSLSRP